MIDKERILKLADKFIERAESWIEDATQRSDWNDVAFYEGEKKVAEEFKQIVERW